MATSDDSRRVVITGAGVISPLGNSKESLWEAIREGRSGVQRMEGLSPESFPFEFAGEAREFTGHINDFGDLPKPLKVPIRKGLKLMCRETQMGVAAAQLALVDGGVEAGSFDPERAGVIYGSDYMLSPPGEFIAAVKKTETPDKHVDIKAWGSEGLDEITPLWLLKYLPNMPASHIAIFNDMRGPNNSITHREAASYLALGEAFHTIQRGHAELIVAGATGTRVHPMKTIHTTMHEELAVGNGDPAAACRPFDLNRTGAVIGEGSCAFIVECEEVAEKRGASILGEIVGAGSSVVIGKDATADRRKALANAMRAALADASLSATDVGHVNAHGLSSRTCDVDEARAIADVFGDEPNVPVVAAKSYFGNLGAGSGNVELVASLMALGAGSLFRVLNYDQPDPDCGINVVADDQAPAGDTVLATSVTPQGQASAILIRRM
ncbi:MAG: beta-ketoacyl-[acyl-carrier-protein] synthase family protein [Pirellulales bacterium]|nr:beta-ketoacyl-[acyl-carrier-protein] synthase family protein [Pirellulales bacterium]